MIFNLFQCRVHFERAIFVFFICVFGFSIISNSQSTKSENSEDAFELMDVSLEDLLNVGIVSASKKKQSVADAPATAYVVTKEQIKNRGYTNLSELLEDIPEIEVQRNSNPEYRNVFSIRGISGNEKFLILLNGIRITPATGDGYTLGSNFSLVNAQRVEVILGPASALYGVDAFSGIVNIISNSQEVKDFKGIVLNTSYGNYNSSNNSFSGGAKVGRVSFSLSGNYYISKEPNYNVTNPEQFQWYNKQTAANGTIIESPYYQRINSLEGFERGAGNSFFGSKLSRGFAMPTNSHYLNADLSYGNFTVGYTRHYESHNAAYGIDPKYTLYDAGSSIAQKQEVVYGKHNFTSFNKKWGLQSTFTQSIYETNPNSNFSNSSSRWQRGFIYSFGQSSKLEEQLNYNFSSRISLVVGILYENLSSLPRTGLSQKPFDKKQPGALQDLYFIGAAGYKPNNPDENPVYNDSLAVKQNFYYLNYQNYGGYMQFQLTPWDFLEITLGSRYDYNTRFGETFNPRLGLVLLPNKKFRFKVLYGEAYLAPSPKKAYEQAGAFYSYDPKTGKLVADYFRIPNPELKPEKLRELEANTSYFFTQNFTIGANAYYTKIENLIDLFGVAPTSLVPKNINATRLETSVNQGKAEMYGGTVKMNLLNKIGQINVNWFVSYSYMDGKINQQALPFTAKNSAKGGVEISVKRFSITPRFIYRDVSFSNQKLPDSDTFYSNDAYIVSHINANFLLIDQELYKVRISFKVNNLTNNKYYNVFSGNEEGMGFTPQDPTRFMAGINMEF